MLVNSVEVVKKSLVSDKETVLVHLKVTVTDDTTDELHELAGEGRLEEMAEGKYQVECDLITGWEDLVFSEEDIIDDVNEYINRQ